MNVNLKATPHLIIGAIFLYCLINCLDITTYPTIGADEAMLNDPARVLATGGGLRTTVFGDQHGFDRIYLFQPFGQTFVMTAIYRVFGFGLLQTRLPGVLGAGVCLWMLYCFVSRVSGSGIAGSVAAMLLALTPGFVNTSRAGRMDVFCIILLLAGCISWARSGGKSVARTALWIGAAGWMHLIALSFVAAGFAVLIARRRLRDALVFGIVGGLPLCVWAGFGLLHGWMPFHDQLLHHAVLRSAADLGWLGRIAAELRHWGMIYAHTPVLGFVLVASAICVFKLPALAELRIPLAVTLLFNTFVMGKTTGFYYLYPALFASAAAGIVMAAILDPNSGGGTKVSRADEGERPAHQTPNRVLLTRVVLTLLVINSLAVIYSQRLLAWRYQSAERSYAALDRALRQFPFAGATVLGSGPEWYTLESMGAHFQITYLEFVTPDAARQDYFIVNAADLTETPRDFEMAGEIPLAFPQPFGLKLSNLDYHFFVFRSKRRGL